MIRIAAIDPGSTSGVIALSLPEMTGRIDNFEARQRTYNLQHARLIDARTLTIPGATKGRDDAIRHAQLFIKAREWLATIAPDHVVLEYPVDALPTFGAARRGANDQGGKVGRAGVGRGTIFSLGRHYGLLEAAAAATPSVERVFTYQCTTTKPRGRSQSTEKVIGWMQRRESRPIKREVILRECGEIMRQLRQRPFDGIIRSSPVKEDENIMMALGVLAFHCDRERGRV